MNVIDLIDEIDKNLNNKRRLFSNLNRVMEIASVFNHQEIIDWVNKELYGYRTEDNIPPYRKIEVIIHKEESLLIPERSYLDSKFLLRPIKEIVKDSKKKVSFKNDENIWGTGITIEIKKSMFKQIIEGVKSKIKTDILKVSKEHNLSREKNKVLKKYEDKKNRELKELETSELSSYLKNDKEKKIFKKNIESYLNFEHSHNYKYCMISIGSIIEFLLIRYCKIKNISPELYNKKKGKNFVNFLEAAIKNDIFGEKSRWQIVQSHIRDFRNYVHISKEVNSTEIDQKWYKTMKPIFEVLYNHFKRNKINDLTFKDNNYRLKEDENLNN